VPQRPMDVVFPSAPSFPSEVDPDWDAAVVAPPPQAMDYHIPSFPQPPPPLIPSAPPYVPPEAGLQPPLPALPVHVSAPPPSVPSSRVELSPSLVVKIQKHCRFAISSLDYEDAEQAKKELRVALELLGG
jgi:vacuolar protein sorting-associated protein VTA1